MLALVIADKRPEADILRIIHDNPVGLVITLGDLTREDLLPLATVTHIPKIGVYGNHDSGFYMPELGIWDMHRKIWQLQGVSFGGFEGCVRYKQDPYAPMYTQDEATALMNGFPAVDIFLSHCPPRGINDEPDVAHQGFDALRTYIDENTPKVWLHGHTYPTDDTIVRQYGPTRIEYTSGYRLIQLP